MAHNLNYNGQTEKHSFFSVKEKAWHNLGQIITDYPTSAKAIPLSFKDNLPSIADIEKNLK